ncbi:MAG: hypothetical protein M3Y50_16610 [Acidobacteriota bacterium]|nr:hypothetical protein [Acidobacteriota bacterium]
MPIVLVFTGAVILIGASTVYNVATDSNKMEPSKSALPSRPATADTQQVSGFEKQQALIQKSDAQRAQLQQAIAALQAKERATQGARPAIPPHESQVATPMPPPRAPRYMARARMPQENIGSV